MNDSSNPASSLRKARRNRTLALACGIGAILAALAVLFVAVLLATREPSRVLSSREFLVLGGNLAEVRVHRRRDAISVELEVTGPDATRDVILRTSLPDAPGPDPEARIEFDEEAHGVVVRVGTWGMRFDLRPAGGGIGVMPTPLPPDGEGARPGRSTPQPPAPPTRLR